MRTADLDTINTATVRQIASGEEGAIPFYGFVDVDFLKCPAFVMFTNADCSVVNEILTHGEFEPGSLRLWLELCRTATCAFDIGSYTGIFALAAASARPDLPVHAFEPNPFTCARMRINKCANAAWNITDYHLALGAETELRKLRWRMKGGRGLPSNATLGIIDLDRKEQETSIVQVSPLLEALVPTGFGSHPVMKIDVEGAEALVFEGLRAILPQLPDIILETFDAGACAYISALLEPYGYRYAIVHEATGALEPCAQLRPSDPAGRDRNHFLTAH